MKRAKVIKDEIVEQNVHFLAVFVETANSCLAILSEDEDKIGTLAVGIPKPKDLLGPQSSSVILGDKHSVSARMFAEYLASRKNKIALVSVYLQTMEESQARSILKELLKKVIQTTTKKEGVTA